MHLHILVLEDSPERREQFRTNLRGDDNFVHFVVTAKECINQLDTEPGMWDVVFLDHDLGGQAMVESGPGTGYEVACWLEQHPEKQPEYAIIHSLNPCGAERMAQAIPGIVYMAPGIWSAGNLGEYLAETLINYKPYLLEEE